MARGFGMTALRAALGGVAGYGQDVAARREREKLDAEMARQQERQAAMDQVMLQDKGYLSMGQQERAKQTGGAAVLRAALMGARDQGAIDQGLSAAAPQQTLTLGGQQFTRESPVAAAARAASRSMYEKQQEDKRTKAEKQAAFNADKQALVDAGETPERAEAALRTGAKYGDLFMSPSQRDASARGWRALQQAAERQAATASGDGGTRSEVASGLQAMGVARASSALNLLESNHRRMEQFESDVLTGKAQVTALQMEAARIAMSGQPGAALAESQLAKGVPFIMPANAKLLQYVRSAKGIAGAVREITPRGGSNLMMQMETALSGIGPGGVDAESIEQVREFRRDQLLGVREGVMALRGQRTGQQAQSTAGEKKTERTGTQSASQADGALVQRLRGAGFSGAEIDAYIARGGK